MPAITTTRVCASLGALDHEWAIVAECPGDGENCVSGWSWKMPLDQVGAFLVARDDDGTITTAQGCSGQFQFTLYAKLRGSVGRKAA